MRDQSIESVNLNYMKDDTKNVFGCINTADGDRSGQKQHYALVLAGGRSRRMGSDKALLRPDGAEGESFLERAVHFWKNSQRVEKVLVAVGQPGHLKRLPEGAEPVYDLLEDRGPMAGILSAFRQTDAELLYVSAVDMPDLRREAILPVPSRDCGAAVYLADGRPEPLFGVYRRCAADAAERLLDSGSGRMSDLLNQVKTEYHEASPHLQKMFGNINTPEDFKSRFSGFLEGCNEKQED